MSGVGRSNLSCEKPHVLNKSQTQFEKLALAQSIFVGDLSQLKAKDRCCEARGARITQIFDEAPEGHWLPLTSALYFQNLVSTLWVWAVLYCDAPCLAPLLVRRDRYEPDTVLYWAETAVKASQRPLVDGMD